LAGRELADSLPAKQVQSEFADNAKLSAENFGKIASIRNLYLSVFTETWRLFKILPCGLKNPQFEQALKMPQPVALYRWSAVKNMKVQRRIAKNYFY
jgi:hypothetical protein